MSLSTVTLKWNVTDLVEAGVQAVLSIAPTAQLLDTSGHVVVQSAVPRQVKFTGSGQLAGIVANDSGVLPPNAGYLISVATVAGAVIVPQFQTQLLAADATDGVLWLDQLATVPVLATGMQYLPASGGRLLGGVAPAAVALTDAATVTPDATLGNDFRLQMTAAVGASRTVAAATPVADGQTIRIMLVQPASGGPCSVTWADAYNFGRSAGPPDLGTDAGDRDLLGFGWDATDQQWLFLGPMGY